ncbi:MAG: HD domain-containing protein, partial [Dehalococcoidia bacterium]
VLLGRAVAEVDVVVADEAEAFAAAAAAALETHAVKLDERIGVYRLPLADGHIDIVARVGDLADDLARRDFTINALAYALSRLPPAGLDALDRDRVVDQHDGLRDLQNGLVRMTGPTVLRDDPVRALRAIRFVTELGFQLDAETREAMGQIAAQLGGVAAERVEGELSRVFSAERASAGVELMDASGLLSVCFPELDAGRGIEQRPHHQYDVFGHQLAALRWIDNLLCSAPPADEPAASLWSGLWRAHDWRHSRWGDVREHLQRNSMALRLAVLLHDIGKPATRSIEEDGRTRFFGHSGLGATMARDALKRWRFPSAVIERVALLIDQHLRPGQIASPGEPPTVRALHRFQRAVGDATPDLCWLFLADSLATAGAGRLGPRWGAYVAHVHRIVTWEPPEEARRLQRLVDGRAVMAAAGIGPGPLVGRILRAVEEAAATGEVASQAEALALAAALAKQLGGSAEGATPSASAATMRPGRSQRREDDRV